MSIDPQVASLHSLPIPLLANIFAQARSPLLQYRLVDSTLRAHFSDESFLVTLLMSCEYTSAATLFGPLLGLAKKGRSLTVSAAMVMLMGQNRKPSDVGFSSTTGSEAKTNTTTDNSTMASTITTLTDSDTIATPEVTAEDPEQAIEEKPTAELVSVPDILRSPALKTFSWLLSNLPLITLLIKDHWLDALKRASVPPSERDRPYCDSSWRYAREAGEAIPLVGSKMWCDMIDYCTVRLGLGGTEEEREEPEPEYRESDEDEEEKPETEPKPELVKEQKSGRSHLGGNGPWPLEWTEVKEVTVNDEVLILRSLREDIVSPEYYLLAKFDLMEIAEEVQRNWPYGGQPFPLPRLAPGVVYFFAKKDDAQFWANSTIKFWYGDSSTLVSVSTIKDYEVKFRRYIMRHLRKFPRELAPQIDISFRLEVSIANFDRDYDWTTREWLHEHEHHWEDHNRCRSWMFGWLCTYNPERSSMKHNTILQSWSIWKTKWKWGDLDALVLQGRLEEGSCQITIMD